MKNHNKIIINCFSYKANEKGKIQEENAGIIQNLEDQSIDTMEIPTSSINEKAIPKELLDLLVANYNRRRSMTEEKQEEQPAR